MRVIFLAVFWLFLASCTNQAYLVERERHYDLPVDFDPITHDKFLTYMPAGYYPKKLCDSGYEGYVIVEFNINEHGYVENPVVSESDSEEQFGKIAIERILHAKYEPRTIEGRPMSVQGAKIRTKFCSSNCREDSGKDCAHRSTAC
ncbi:energy transducer TonB [Microbulbifer celer]|uniref:Energy transducer TonB n=1 Tax=Microbulbifer celer TaxID=435905 RepID=A0ABW3U2B7_9GAMM|nr:energy transducer TonB [Microbulbifer celer]UFN55872.1 energy transducer TonB [Microbulbifer celer]